jgi:hypothetical protein
MVFHALGILLMGLFFKSVSPHPSYMILKLKEVAADADKEEQKWRLLKTPDYSEEQTNSGF